MTGEVALPDLSSAWLLVIDPQRIFADPGSDWASPLWDEAWERIRELAAHVGPERTLVSRWLPTADRNIAQVFQFPVVYDTMTVAENLAFPLRNRGRDAAYVKDRVDRIARMIGLEAMLPRRAQGLTADAKQKISLGRGMVRQDVNAILFDEPLTVIDPQMKWELRTQLKALHRDFGHTMIYVTHDQTEALTFADEVVVMSEGRVVQAGTPQALFETPAHTFVGHFIGSPGMNLLDAQVEGATAHVAGAAVPLGAAYAPGAGRVQIGIRPDAAHLATAGAGLPFRIERIEDRLVNSCTPPPSERGCVAGESVCSSGPAVRTIMGFPVSRECWAYRQDHTCPAGDHAAQSDCGPFEADPSCEVIGQTCLSEVEADEDLGGAPAGCQHWEYRYRCGGGMELREHCTAFNVCVGSLCEGVVDEPNTDFGNAAAWLTMLDEAAKDSEKSIEMQQVSLFAGTARNCRIGALSTINCCNDSGWANGILGECSENELALMDRVAAKAAIYVGTYCSRRVLGVCLQRRRSYCTFNSQLAMVFQKEIRRLAGADWGSARHPNCAGLRLDEMESIDWDRIDLSEAFEDMMNDANVPTSEMVTDYLRDRLDLTAGAVGEEGGP